MPTPARSAISFAGASTPEVPKTSFAASSSESILRCASARSRRGARSGAPVTVFSATVFSVTGFSATTLPFA
jgi:hypothetical protein